MCDEDFAELSGELSGAICLKILVLLGSALELFRKFFGAVRAIFRLWGSLLALGWGLPKPIFFTPCTSDENMIAGDFSRILTGR